MIIVLPYSFKNVFDTTISLSLSLRSLLDISSSSIDALGGKINSSPSLFVASLAPLQRDEEETALPQLPSCPIRSIFFGYIWKVYAL